VETISDYINEQLNRRKADSSLRELKHGAEMLDFCSNDYLSFSRSAELRALFEQEVKNHPVYRLGASGSRLLAGNDTFTEDLESEIADFHVAEAALLYNSGYDANVGVFSCLPQRGDTIICDEYIHASIIDGVRLSHATRFVFKHNDLESLEEKLKVSKGKIFIAVESVYSMDGDEAPLEDICDLAEKFGAAVIVDEAHAVGVFGPHGRGISHELGLNSRVFARVVTFGKALGVHGAAILGSAALRTYLINFSRSFIYSTAAPFLSHMAIKVAYGYLKAKNHQADLYQRIQHFRSGLKPGCGLIPSRSAIQALVIPGNVEARKMASYLQSADFDVRAILSPTVAAGSERLRICIHQHNSLKDITGLCQTINYYL
jgi:8-amino-7-oxononanoate synthase